MNGGGPGCSSAVDGFAAEPDSSDITFTRVRAYGNGGDGFDLQGDQVTLNDVASTGNACTGIKLYQNAMVRGCLAVSNARGIAVTSLAGGSVVDIAQCTVAANNGVALDLTTPKLPGTTYAVHLHNSILSGDFKAIQYVRAAVLSEDHNIVFRPSPYDPGDRTGRRHQSHWPRHQYRGCGHGAAITARERSRWTRCSSMRRTATSTSRRRAPRSAAACSPAPSPGRISASTKTLAAPRTTAHGRTPGATAAAASTASSASSPPAVSIPTAMSCRMPGTSAMARSPSTDFAPPTRTALLAPMR